MAPQLDGDADYLDATTPVPLPLSTSNTPRSIESTWIVATDASGETPSERSLRIDNPATTKINAAFPQAFGEYQLLGELGSGGMGVVYEARQEALNRTVALKMVRAGILATDRETQRFQNEAEAIALLDHPHIVPIYDVGQVQGQRYFSMRLIPGGSLSARLDEHRTSARTVAGLMLTIAQAVHHAHRRGILHCDLKPANILIDEDGQPHVTDFGLAKRVDLESSATRTTGIMGTPPYMAPEQVADERTNVTVATDVYGLGALLYALLTGRAPFAEKSVLETLNCVREQTPDPPGKHNPAVPQDLETICLKCLEKDPQRRYESAQDLADDLRRWLAGEPIVARPVGSTVRLWMWCKRKPAYASLVASLAIALIVGFGGMATLWQQAETERDEKEMQRQAAVDAQAEAERSAKQLRLAFDEIDQRRTAELELRERTSDLEDQLCSVEEEINRLDTERQHTRLQLQQRSKVIEGLRKKLTDVSEESVKISELESELAEAEREMHQLHKANESIVGKLQTRGGEVTRLRQKLVAAEAEKKRIRQQLDAQVRRSRNEQPGNLPSTKRPKPVPPGTASPRIGKQPQNNAGAKPR